MDWNFKPGSGYLSGLDQELAPDIPNMGDSISFQSPKLQQEGDFSFDLKLGNVGSSSSSGNNNTEAQRSSSSSSKWKEVGGAKMEFQELGSSFKRGRGCGNQPPYCLVDGCDSDFSNCREYHRRHKVCEVHSKTPVVTINGKKQRFCQQCSRFHSLGEFDEGKRSCRKRLDGHNRRRRKPQPDPASRPSSFLTSFQDTELLHFSTSHVFPTAAISSSGWNGGFVSGSHYGNGHKSLLTSSLTFPVSSPLTTSSVYYKAEKQIPFLQDNSRTAQSCERLLPDCIHDSSRALSLLSSSSAAHRTLPSSPDTTSLSHHNQHVLRRCDQPSSVHLVVQPLPSLSPETGVYGYAGSTSDGSSVVSGNESVSAPLTFPFHWE